jgi:hypothetical protein
VLIHGDRKRLLKSAADASGPTRLLRLLSSWAKSHCVIDTSNKRVCITSMSSCLAEDLGYRAEEFLGSDLSCLLGPGTRSKTATSLVRCTRGVVGRVCVHTSGHSAMVHGLNPPISVEHMWPGVRPFCVHCVHVHTGFCLRCRFVEIRQRK